MDLAYLNAWKIKEIEKATTQMEIDIINAKFALIMSGLKK